MWARSLVNITFCIVIPEQVCGYAVALLNRSDNFFSLYFCSWTWKPSNSLSSKRSITLEIHICLLSYFITILLGSGTSDRRTMSGVEYAYHSPTFHPGRHKLLKNLATWPEDRSSRECIVCNWPSLCCEDGPSAGYFWLLQYQRLDWCSFLRRGSFFEWVPWWLYDQVRVTARNKFRCVFEAYLEGRAILVW